MGYVNCRFKDLRMSQVTGFAFCIVWFAEEEGRLGIVERMSVEVEMEPCSMLDINWVFEYLSLDFA
jgi:hypothetical protein